MAYYLAKFFRYIPQIDGMTHVGAVDNFNIINVSTDAALAALKAHPDNIPLVELTETEATIAWKFYGETRGYRKAYSDVEGLTPDADELAKGSRKTKVYHTPDTQAASISLMKKAFHLHIEEEMKDRRNKTPNLDGSTRPHYDKTKHDQLNAQADSLNTIDDICKAREEVLGIEMSRDLANRLGLCDSNGYRAGKVKFGVQF